MGLRDLATDRLTGVLPIDSRGEETAPSLVLPMSAERCAPSMLAPRELNYIHWLASQTSGYGNVVELGCFLGG